MNLRNLTKRVDALSRDLPADKFRDWTDEDLDREIARLRVEVLASGGNLDEGELGELIRELDAYDAHNHEEPTK